MGVRGLVGGVIGVADLLVVGLVLLVVLEAVAAQVVRGVAILVEVVVRVVRAGVVLLSVRAESIYASAMQEVVVFRTV